MRTVLTQLNSKSTWRLDLKSPFTSIPLALALDCTETAINNSTINLSLPTDDLMNLLNLFLTFRTTASIKNSCMEQLWVHQFPLLQKSLCKTSRNEPSQLRNEHYHSDYATLTIPLQLFTKTKSTIFTNTSTDKHRHICTVYYGEWSKMLKYLF